MHRTTTDLIQELAKLTLSAVWAAASSMPCIPLACRGLDLIFSASSLSPSVISHDDLHQNRVSTPKQVKQKDSRFRRKRGITNRFGLFKNGRDQS